MESKELQKICRKLGQQGSIITSIFLIGSIVHEEKPPLITFGILTVSLIGSNLLLVKSYKYSKVKSDKVKLKLKKQGRKI